MVRRKFCIMILTLFVLTTSLTAPPDERMNLDHNDYAFTPTTVRFVNDLKQALRICWVPPNHDEELKHPCAVSSQPCICEKVNAGASQDMHSTVESRWVISDGGGSLGTGSLLGFVTSLAAPSPSPSLEILGSVFLFGGKHIYTLSQYVVHDHKHKHTPPATPPTRGVIHVHGPDDCSSQTGYDVMGPLWRDAARVAAFRHNYSLCLCGDYNASSTYTMARPNPELPVLLDGDQCGCGNGVRNDAMHFPGGESRHVGVYTTNPAADPSRLPLFHLYLPCSFTILCAQQFQLAVNCNPSHAQLEAFFRASGGSHPEAGEEERLQQASTAELKARYFSSLRISMLHSTVEVDRLTLKNKLWSTLLHYYGSAVAGLIMPPSYHWESAEERMELYALCSDIVAADGNKRHVFIMKDPSAHRQQGIQLGSAAQILQGKAFGPGLFTMATRFLPEPFLVRGFKINIRRYMVAVCIRGRLRGYVHDDGKNIYTKLPYREPWDGEDDWAGGDQHFTASSAGGDSVNRRLEEMITTGYVPASHFDDKPLSGLEFAEWVEARYHRPKARGSKLGGGVGKDANATALLFASTHARLALALHASRRDELHDLCGTRSSGDGDERMRASLREALHSEGFVGDLAVSSGEDVEYNEAPLADENAQDFAVELDAETGAPVVRGLAQRGLAEDHMGIMRGYNTPRCIEPSIRFMHFGCDFHLDAPLTGHGSRLFECNKGPDMSAHSYRDGKMKRGVAADILSFIGLTGKFDGSAAAARRFRMTLVYDSDDFDPTETVRSLARLKHQPPLQPRGGGDGGDGGDGHIQDPWRSEL